MIKPLQYGIINPLLSAFIFVCFISPFIFVSPPAAFVETLWILATLGTTLIFWKKENNFIRFVWLSALSLAILFGIDNLLYAYSVAERWWVFGCNIFAIVLCCLVFTSKQKSSNKYSSVFRFALYILLSGNILSVIFNVLGHFALAKLLSNSSVLQFVLAVCLSFLTELFTEAIYLQIERMKSMKTEVYLEYDNIRSKFKSYLNIGAIAFWVFGFIWSLSFQDMIMLYLSELFTQPISIGDLSFSLKSAFIFSITLWIAVLISNLLAIIFGTAEQQFASTKKSKVGSWMMLVRLAIISGGFLFAVGAAGISVDKFTIVFGALSVGIGFGLQNIVGNLVSGIILAFEKPIQVGDVIEIGNQTGTVKQIGIRSSKITTYDGADIIVPNGEFISQKLTNWTHSNPYKRVELIIGVSYGTQLEKVNEVVQAVLSNQKGIMKFPVPSIMVHQFADSAVNFRVLFWAEDFDNWIQLKGNVLRDVYNAFAENNIHIPFPQQDIYIKSMPNNKDTTES